MTQKNQDQKQSILTVKQQEQIIEIGIKIAHLKTLVKLIDFANAEEIELTTDEMGSLVSILYNCTIKLADDFEKFESEMKV